MTDIAEFRYFAPENIWLPANKNAVAATAIISKRFLRDTHDILAVRAKGYIPVDVLTGDEIFRIDVMV